MLRRFFRYIRRQPRPVRDRYAFSFAAVFTGGVTLVWLMNTTFFDFSQREIVQEKEGSAAFSTIVKQSKEQLAGLSNIFKGGNLEEGEDSNHESLDDEVLVSGDPTKIVLSDEDLDIAKQQELESIAYIQNSSTTSSSTNSFATSTATSSSTNNNSAGSSTKPVYQEVQIVTFSSSSSDAGLKNASSTSIENKKDVIESNESTPTN